MEKLDSTATNEEIVAKINIVLEFINKTDKSLLKVYECADKLESYVNKKVSQEKVEETKPEYCPTCKADLK